MDYSTNQIGTTKTQSRQAHAQWRAYRARKWARIVMVALILTGSVAAILEDNLGRGIRAQIIGAIGQLEMSKDDSTSIGKFLQAALTKLNY